MTTSQSNPIKWAWLILLLIIVVAIIAGCSTAQKLLNKAERKDPAIVAKYARDKYPCTDLLNSDTAVIWKDSIIYIDCLDNNNIYIERPDPFEVVVIKTDTVKNTIVKTVRVPVTVPIQVKIITKWYEDSAKLKICATELNKAITAAQKLQAANNKLTAKADHRGKENWIWRLIATVLICWQAWKIYRKFKV